MPSWDFVRSPAGVRLLLETGADHGVGPERCLRATGLTVEALADAATRVEAGQELQVVRNLVEATGDPPGLGVDAGRRTSIASLGVWGYAVLTSPTWGDALSLALRFAELSSTFLAAELGGTEHELQILLRDDEIPADVRDFLVERDLAAVAALIPVITGTDVPGRIETRLTGERGAALSAALPASVASATGRPRNLLAAPARLLETALPQADEATRRACERECERLLDARAVRTGTAARVRARLLERPDRMPSMEDVAAGLHLDVRTLRRHLAAEGTNYRALREEVCETLAVEMLRTLGLSVGEVAARLGYSDATAFTHAFRRWTGSAPSAFR